MLVAGIDVGSLTAKAVLLKDNNIVASAVIRATTRPARSAEEVLSKALEKAGKTRGDVAQSVATGYGRNQIPFVDQVASEIACHARGAVWRLPSVRTIIDIGGQDAKAARVDAQGNVIRYGYNDKCASGTGRFLEVMAEALEVPLEQLGALSQKSTDPVRISSQCVVFAETEVISLLNKGREVPDVIAGLHLALAGRVAALARSISLEPDVVFTGGVAKNSGVAAALEKELGISLKFLDIDPQINGAAGAALFAAEALSGRMSA